MLKRFPSDKINCTKDALFFLSRNPVHHSFTFSLVFLLLLVLLFFRDVSGECGRTKATR